MSDVTITAFLLNEAAFNLNKTFFSITINLHVIFIRLFSGLVYSIDLLKSKLFSQKI